MPSLRLALAFVLFAATTAAPVLAQTGAAPASPPPHLVIDTVGPDGWRIRFGPTNIGGLLESERGRELWQPGVMPVLAMWQQLVGDEPAFTAARSRLLGYGGRIRFAGWIEDNDARVRHLDHAVLVLDPAGTTDMQALAADLKRLQDIEPGEWTKVEVAGQTHEVRTHSDGSVTAPVVADGRVFVFLARDNRLADAIIAGRAFAAAEAVKPLSPTSPALRLHFDAPAIVAMGKKLASESEAKVMDALGLASLGPTTMTVSTAGPFVQAELAQAFTVDKPQGLFAAFCPTTTAVPELQRLVSAETTAWKVGRFDFAALLDTILAAIIASGDVPEGELRQEMRDELGIELDKDLFAHMRDEVLFVGSPLSGLDKPSEFTWALAVQLRDEKAFAAGMATMLGKAKPFLSREGETKVGDIELQRYGNMLGYDVWFATGHGLFLMAGGRDAEERLTQLVNAAATPAVAGAPPTVATKAFGPLRSALPPGNNGLARMDLDSVLAKPAEWWFLAVEDLMVFGGPMEVKDPEQREAVRALLQQHNLATIYTATGFDRRTWRWRLFW
jgi:hypothetical protein